MATYAALVSQAQADQLKLQVKFSIAVTAFTITGEPPATLNHAARVTWAKAALANPDAAVEQIMWYVLAANASATIAAINAATDAAVQANVDAAVTGLFGT